jgi:dephospho-CoA kinase
MSAWAGKTVIGLTGNIAVGKSVVRRMLEHLGAYTIDADALAHRAMAKGAPGYGAVVGLFGRWVVGADGEIDRARLGRIVFGEPEALAQLEAILHPLVRQAIDILVRRAEAKVVVIEAIKLFESGLADASDAVWVVYAPPEVQLARLMQKRGLTEAAARQRIQAQPPQEAKIRRAQVVIRNIGSFEDAWRQVSQGWAKLVPTSELEPATSAVKPGAKGGALTLTRGRPRQSQEIAEIINRLHPGSRRFSREDVMAAFGEKAFMLLNRDGDTVGVVGWKVENLVARTDEVYLDRSVDWGAALKVAMQEIERTSQGLQCEVSLLFLPRHIQNTESLSKGLGYQMRTVQSLGVRAWQEAAMESMPPNTQLLFKQLRVDRVLRPV